MVTHQKIPKKKAFKKGQKPSRAIAYRRVAENAKKIEDLIKDEHDDIKKKTCKKIYKVNEDLFEEVLEEFFSENVG